MGGGNKMGKLIIIGMASGIVGNATGSLLIGVALGMILISIVAISGNKRLQKAIK